jgi:cytochrome c5
MWESVAMARRNIILALVIIMAAPTSAKESEIRGIDGIGQDPGTAIAFSLTEFVAGGERIYRYRCVKCHGKNGEGQPHGHDDAPRLRANAALLSVSRIAVQVLRGGAYMPPFNSLSNREIAAVATYIRNSFGKNHTIVTEAEVEAYR